MIEVYTSDISEKQLQLVRESIRRIRTCMEVSATLFYSQFYTKAPSSLSIRKMSPTQQTKIFVSLLESAAILVDPTKDDAAARGFAEDLRIVLGEHSENLPIVKDSLSWAMRQLLGPDFADDVSSAWHEALSALVVRAADGVSTLESI